MRWQLDHCHVLMCIDLIGQIKRAHDESKRKADLGAVTRKNLRESTRTHGTLYTSQRLAWVDIVDAQGKLFPPEARKLHKIPGAHFVPNKHAAKSIKLMFDAKLGCAVMGEWQPHKKAKGKRVPDGDPILGCYPRVIEPKLFLDVQKKMKARASKLSSPIKKITRITWLNKWGDP